MFRQVRPYWCGPAALVALQLELGSALVLTQAEWAELAGTSSTGTGVHGLKRCLRLLGQYRIARRPQRPFGLAVVFDHRRDHWIVVRCIDGVAVMLDPWDGAIDCFPWAWFRRTYFAARDSYALIVSR